MRVSNENQLGHWLRFSAGPVLALSVCGCTVLMTEPTPIDTAQRKAGISYESALNHLEDARTKMKKGLNKLDHLNNVTVGGVGVGTGGAAIATLAGAHADVAMGLLTIGGVTYAVNQTSRLQTQTAIYTSGLKRLRCVDENGYRLFRATDGLRAVVLAQGIPFEAARIRLVNDVALARAKPMSKLLEEVVAEGVKALDEASKVKKAMDDFISATDVGFEMVSAVDATVESVNAQVRANKADATEVAGAGKLAANFIAADAAAATSDGAEKGASDNKLKALGQLSHEPMADQIRTGIDQLRVQADAVRALLPASPIRAASVGSCLTDIAAVGSVTILPSATITVVPGGDTYGLNAFTEDGQALVFNYSGPTPTSQQLSASSQGGSRFNVSAPSDARPGQYAIRFCRANDLKCLPLDPPLVINVAAKAAVPNTVARRSAASAASPAEMPVQPKLPTAQAGTTPAAPVGKLPIPKPPTLAASAVLPASAASK
jgi:hypothetical protein